MCSEILLTAFLELLLLKLRKRSVSPFVQFKGRWILLSLNCWFVDSMRSFLSSWYFLEYRLWGKRSVAFLSVRIDFSGR